MGMLLGSVSEARPEDAVACSAARRGDARCASAVPVPSAGASKRPVTLRRSTVPSALYSTVRPADRPRAERECTASCSSARSATGWRDGRPRSTVRHGTVPGDRAAPAGQAAAGPGRRPARPAQPGTHGSRPGPVRRLRAADRARTGRQPVVVHVPRRLRRRRARPRPSGRAVTSFSSGNYLARGLRVLPTTTRR